MALSANSVFEVRTAGSDTNGGGFVTGAAGQDYSQQDSKNTVGSDISVTNGVGNGSTTFTSATANFGTTIVGNIIYLQGGTGSLAAGWYQVTARASTSSITLDRTVASGTGITVNIGGALASFGMAGGVGLVSGATIHIKAGTYTISSATANVTGGCFSSSLAILTVIGYQSTRLDNGTQPLLQCSGISTFTVITMTGATAACYNVGIDCAGLTSSRGIQVRNVVYRCYVLSPTNSGLVRSTTTTFVRCYVTGHTTQPGCNNGNFVECYCADGTTTGFALASADYAYRCIADSNSGGSSSGFTCAGSNHLNNCVSYNNGNVGYLCSSVAVVFMNCIAESNAGVGFSGAAQDNVLLLSCAIFGDTITGITGVGSLQVDIVTGSVSFFVDAANHNFALNNDAGGGADLRGAGSPGSALGVGGTGYLDIGAVQHLAAATRGYARA